MARLLTLQVTELPRRVIFVNYSDCVVKLSCKTYMTWGDNLNSFPKPGIFFVVLRYFVACSCLLLFCLGWVGCMINRPKPLFAGKGIYICLRKYIYVAGCPKAKFFLKSTCASAWIGNGLAAMRSARVEPEVNLNNPLHTGDEAAAHKRIRPGFETQGRRRQKSKQEYRWLHRKD